MTTTTSKTKASKVAVKPWRIDYGIHRGTITSRDSGSTSTSATNQPLTSLDECREALRTIERELFCGYVIWYAYAIDPATGESTQIHQGNSYRS